MKLYIAASSAEIDRARHWRDRCVAAGIEVVSSWIENVERVGEANPRDATIEQRQSWSSRCLREAKIADQLWLLYPSMSTMSASGALVEFGFVLGAWSNIASSVVGRNVGLFGDGGPVRRILISGDTKRSIFCALGREYATDEEAFAAIQAEAKR